jgi:hypothetical protein
LPELLRFPLIERERELVGLIGEELVTELRAGALLSRKLRRAPTSDNTADPELT